MWGGLFRPSASGGRRGVALRLCPPSLFPAVLEQTYLLPLCFRGSDRGPAIIATVKFADLRPCGGPSACKTDGDSPLLQPPRPDKGEASRQLRQRWAGEYNASGFVAVARGATSRSTHYTMAARRGQECKLCRYGGGVCQRGFRQVHIREDPQRRHPKNDGQAG